MYPYCKSSTILAVLLLPPNCRRGVPSTRWRRWLIRAACGVARRFTDDFLQDLYLGCLPADTAQFAGLISMGFGAAENVLTSASKRRASRKVRRGPLIHVRRAVQEHHVRLIGVLPSAGSLQAAAGLKFAGAGGRFARW